MTISILTVMDSLKLKTKTMKQTAVELLFDKLWDTPKDKFTWYAILEQAKEMEKQQIIEAAERWKGTDFAEKYYAETYGSNGSDEHFEDNLDEIPTSSQTEISDEVTRLEVIDKQGRVYSQWNCSIELSYQDDGKTLKIFVNN